VKKLKTLIKKSPVWPLLRPRRFQAYGIGAAKTGTVALAAMLRPRYRSAHEPSFHETIDLVMTVASGMIDGGEMRRRLRKRDRDLWLEMESSHLMVAFCRDLVDEFPNAKFILTVRECRNWLDSIINQHLNVDVSERPKERAFRNLLYGAVQEPRDKNDELLLSRGLFSVTGYLMAWAQHNETVIEAVPDDRLLVLRTENLSESIPQISAFLGIPVSSIGLRSQRYHVAPRRHGVVDMLSQRELELRVQETCGQVVLRLNEHLPRNMWLGCG